MARAMSRDGVDRAVEIAFLERQVDDADEVAPVNPWHPLLAVAQWAAREERERPHEARQRAAALIQHDTGAQQHHARAKGAGLRRLLLPLHAKVREEIGRCPGRRGLIDLAIAGIAVVPDGGSVEQDSRTPNTALRGRRHFHGADDLMRAVNTAGDDRLLVGPGPSMISQACSGQMHDRIAARDRRLPRAWRGDIAGDDCDVAVGVGGEEPAGLRSIAREQHHLVASLQAIKHESPADEAGRASDEDSHAGGRSVASGKRRMSDSRVPV